MRCIDFYKKWEREPNWCEKTPGAVSQIDSYLELVRDISTRGLEKDLIFTKFPEGAARVVISLKDDDRHADLLNYVIACLKRDEKITAGDLKKFTNVKSGTSVAEVKPKNTVPPAPIAPVLKEKYGGDSPEDLPQLSPEADMDERLKRDEELLKRAGFQKAFEYDPVTGGKFIKEYGTVKVVKAREPITWMPSDKQWEFIEQVIKSREFETPLEFLSGLVDRAMEES